LSTKKAPSPYPRLSYADALARFGTDKPDLRFGLEIVDVTGARGRAYGAAHVCRAPGRGNVVRSLLAPGRPSGPQLVRRLRGGGQGAGDHRELASATGGRQRLQRPLSRKLTADEMGTLVAATGAGTVTPSSPASGPSIRQCRPRPGPGRPRPRPRLADPTSSPFVGSSIFPCSSAIPRRANGISRITSSDAQEACERWRQRPGRDLAYQVRRGVQTGSSFPPEPSATTCRGNGKGVAIAGYFRDRIERSFPGPVDLRVPPIGAPPMPVSPPEWTVLSCSCRTSPTSERSSPSAQPDGARPLEGAPAQVTPAQLARASPTGGTAEEALGVRQLHAAQ